MGGQIGRSVAKLLARQLATAAFWNRIQTSLKNTKWATEAKEWPTHSSPAKNIQQKKTLHALRISLYAVHPKKFI
jgi:hypothetical protein